MFFVFRSSLCTTLVFSMAALCYTPRADAFIFGELKELGRAVVGTVKGVGRDVRSTGSAVKQAFTPDRSPAQEYRQKYEKRMSKQVREQRREMRRAERRFREDSDAGSDEQYQEQVEKAEKRMRQASRRAEEMSRRDSRRFSKSFGASDQQVSGRARDEYRWLSSERRERRQEERGARIGDFRARHLDRR